MRIGGVTIVFLVITIIRDIVGVLMPTISNDSNIDLGIGIISIALFYYGISGKWINKIKNKKSLRNIIDYCTSISLLVFIFEKILLSVCKNDKEIKWETIGLLIFFVLSIIALIICMVKRKDWKYNVE